MRKAVFLVSILLFFLTAMSVTTSAAFGVEIQNADRKAVVDVIVADLTALGYSILAVNDYQVAFRKDVENMLGQIFLGSRFNPVPELRACFNVVAVGQNVRITLDVRVVSNPNSAFEQQMPVTDKSWQVYLEVLRRKFNGYVGYGLSCSPTKKNGCFEIAEVLPGSSAEAEGLKPGDLIVQINGRPASKMTQKNLESSVAGPEGSTIMLVIRTISGERTVTLAKTFIPGQYQKEYQTQPSSITVDAEPPSSPETANGAPEQPQQPTEWSKQSNTCE